MKYLLRMMTIDDIPEVMEGETRAFGHTLGYDMLYDDLVLNPYANYIVLEIDKHVRGYIGLWINEDNAEIINFYVDVDYQSNGFGQMLLDFAIRLCDMSNIPSLSLEVRRSNARAISLYEKNGFVYSHDRKSYYQDGEDALVYIKQFEVKK